MPDIYVPNLTSFANDNVFLGSYNGLRFRLAPELEAQDILAEYWFGPLCYESSEMDGDRRFPLTEAGIAEMTEWLKALSEAGKPEELS